MSANALELREVFRVHRSAEGDAAALQGLSLKLRHGERVCVLGPSGAGKTTLLRVVAGLETPSAGSVLVFGTDIGRESPQRRARLRHRLIGFLDQRAEASLPPALTIGAAVALPLALRGVRRSERRARARGLLAAAGLGDRADDLPGRLSGGERQRAALCAALAHRPALLLADEPTAELDAGSARQMASLIDELAAADATTVLTVSHDPAMGLGARRVLRMRDGRIVEERRDGDASVMIGDDGWVALPRPLLDQSGIAGRARVAVAPAGLVLTPARDTQGANKREVARVPAPGAQGAARVPAPSAHEAAPGPVPGPTAPHQAVSVHLDGVSRWRGQGANRRAVIVDLSMEFEPGCLTVVTGRSGSGKTTLLELVAGLQRPDAGRLCIAGEDLAGASPEDLAETRRRWVGYLPQEPTPVGFLSAIENVALALHIRGASADDAVRRAEAVLVQVGLAQRQRQRSARLSAGEAQRVALARALACADGVLVVDEPTSRLDGLAGTEIAQLLHDAARRGQTVICATHDPRLIEPADRVLELERLALRPEVGHPVATHNTEEPA